MGQQLFQAVDWQQAVGKPLPELVQRSLLPYIWGYEEEDYMKQRYTHMASGHSLHILLRLHI